MPSVCGPSGPSRLSLTAPLLVSGSHFFIHAALTLVQFLLAAGQPILAGFVFVIRMLILHGVNIYSIVVLVGCDIVVFIVYVLFGSARATLGLG